MHTAGSLNQSLKALKARIEYVNKAWTVDTYERLLRFYVRVVPRLLEAERCSIFILDPSSKRILSKLGTIVGWGDRSA